MSESDKYNVIQKGGRSLYKEKGSKFIGISTPINSESDFKEFMISVKKEFHDARHWCYAWKFGTGNNSISGKSDDGEPAHSAADPILGQIGAFDLTNSAVCVVRYFGGTKLGVGGLKQAYKAAAKEAIEESQIIIKQIELPLEFDYPYELSPEIMQLISKYQVTISNQKFEESCSISIAVAKSKFEILKSELLKLEYRGMKFKKELEE